MTSQGEQGLLALLNADANLGPMLAGRLFFDSLPKGIEYPELTAVAGTIALVGGRSYPTFQSRGYQYERYQFSFSAKKASAAADAREALNALLDGFRGLLPGGFFIDDAEYIGPVKMPFDYDGLAFWCGSEHYLKFNL